MGVSICKDMSWTSHINRATKKASSMIGFPKRNLRVANQATKTNAYKTLVHSHLEYCSTVWNHHTANKIKQIETVQKRAVRYVSNHDGPVRERMHKHLTRTSKRRVDPKLAMEMDDTKMHSLDH